MAKVSLTDAADHDLLTIYDTSVALFGERQARSYFASIGAVLESLAEMPELGRIAIVRRRRYRRHEHRSHTIFYREVLDGILVLRVLHARMDPARHLPIGRDS